MASVIQNWQEDDKEKLEDLRKALELIGLTDAIKAESVDATKVRLEVSRVPKTPKNRKANYVNIADVGFGVSQVLPVLVALLTARKGQLVYLEQPEIHLHPRAQVKLAEILVQAANRGVVVVAETHSAVLLLAIQTLVAEGKLKPDDTRLHWFTRSNKDGMSTVKSTTLDAQGAYGDWPEDFGDVELALQGRFLDAVVKR